MKRTCALLLLLCGLGATTVAACGDDDGGTMTPDGSTPTPPPPTPPVGPPPPTPPTPPVPPPPVDMGVPTPPTPPTPVPPPPADMGMPPAGATVVPCAGAAPAEMVSWAISSAGLAQTISVGEIVQWTSADFGHTVTAGTPAAPLTTFNERISAGQSVCVRFDVAGSYPYFCAIHPSMTGTVTVE